MKTEGDRAAALRAWGWRDSRLWAVFLMGALLRVGAWYVTSPTEIINDEFSYYGNAWSWLLGAPFNTTRPPATQLINAFAISIFGNSLFVVRGASMFFGCFVPVLVYAVVTQIGTRRAAAIAAAIAAIYPNFIWFSHYAFSETYFLVFFLIVIFAALRLLQRPGVLVAVATGVACGVAALTREVGVMLIAVTSLAVPWFHRRDLGKAVRCAAIVCVAAAMLILPWSNHIYRSSGIVGLVSQTMAMNLYIGNPPRGSRARIMSYGKYQRLGETKRERAIAGRRQALQAIWGRMPWWPFEKLRNVLSLFSPTSFPVKRLMNVPGEKWGGKAVGVWGYDFIWEPLEAMPIRMALAFLTTISFFAVSFVGSVGLATAPGRFVSLLPLIAAAVIVPTLISFSATRFRLPVELLLVAGSGLFLDAPGAIWKGASWRRRLAALASVGVLIWAFASGWKAFLSFRYF